MASSREYLDYVLEHCPQLMHRAMMGEYILYLRGKIVGGIYDDRLLVKPVAAAKRLMPDAELVLPYEGGSRMLLAEDLENREFLQALFEEMWPELPARKKSAR